MIKFCLVLLTALGGLTWAELDLKQLCADKRLDDVFAHPQDCRGYIVCSKEPSVYYCELGFHFDIKRMVCNWPEDANCQLSPEPIENTNDSGKPVYTSLMALDIMTGEVIDPMVGYEPLNVVCRHFGAYFLPNPRKCRSYYLCAYGHMHETSCSPDTLWNYKTQQCVPSHKAVCYQLSEEEKMEINESLANLTHNNSVICYPVDTNATTNQNQDISTTSTTTPIPVPPIMTEASTAIVSKKPNVSNPYGIKCPSRRQTYVAHPKDCSKYFMCIKGIPVMTSCPEGLLWDTKKEYCDFGKNAKCFQEKNI